MARDTPSTDVRRSRVLPRYTSITAISRRPHAVDRGGGAGDNGRPAFGRRRRTTDLSVRRQTRSGPTVDHTRPVRRRPSSSPSSGHLFAGPFARVLHVISSFDCARVCLYMCFFSRVHVRIVCAPPCRVTRSDIRPAR